MCFLSTTFPNSPAHPSPPYTFWPVPKSTVYFLSPHTPKCKARARNTLTPRLTNFFTDFEEKPTVLQSIVFQALYNFDLRRRLRIRDGEVLFNKFRDSCSLLHAENCHLVTTNSLRQILLWNDHEATWIVGALQAPKRGKLGKRNLYENLLPL